MIRAAATFVTEGPRVLAFRQYDREGLSFPCGKIEPGETPAQAAIRETKEETGFDVELESEPFVGFDAQGGALVYTFRARIVGGELLTTPTGEGIPMWASLREIAHGPYWHYNQRILRHFGATVPIAGKFHSHLTIQARSTKEAERAATLVGGKITTIDLSRDGRTQTDHMITHHYMTGARGLEDHTDVVALLKARARQLAESGITVLRVKLEHEPLHDRSEQLDLPLSLSSIYTEIHIKCVVRPENRDDLVAAVAHRSWHPSRNPFATRDDGQLVQFVNRRFYGDVATLRWIDAEVDLITPVILPLATIEEVKYESAVYDSNDEHDRWWMR